MECAEWAHPSQCTPTIVQLDHKGVAYKDEDVPLHLGPLAVSYCGGEGGTCQVGRGRASL